MAVPRATEYAGFALWILSCFVLTVYVVWAATPAHWLEAVHICYYPSRWWAVALPAQLLVLMLYIYVGLASFNIEALTYPPPSFETLTDKDAIMETDPRFLYKHSDGVRDLPQASVCDVLYANSCPA